MFALCLAWEAMRRGASEQTLALPAGLPIDTLRLSHNCAVRQDICRKMSQDLVVGLAPLQPSPIREAAHDCLKER
jgi:hypothetical protein